MSIDRTAELRKYGYEGRRLGPVQMTTDTAVRVTRIVVEDQSMPKRKGIEMGTDCDQLTSTRSRM